MRSLLLSLVLGAASLGMLAVSPSRADAQLFRRWAVPYYNTYSYPAYTYSYPYPTYRYYWGPTYYYSPGYPTSYSYYPGYATYYYATPGYYGYYGLY
jgi:hypothetical protein